MYQQFSRRAAFTEIHIEKKYFSHESTSLLAKRFNPFSSPRQYCVFLALLKATVILETAQIAACYYVNTPVWTCTCLCIVLRPGWHLHLIRPAWLFCFSSLTNFFLNQCTASFLCYLETAIVFLWETGQACQLWNLHGRTAMQFAFITFFRSRAFQTWETPLTLVNKGIRLTFEKILKRSAK